MSNLADRQVLAASPLRAKPAKAARSRGQILILFVMAIFVFTGMVALVIDVSWYWVSSLRIQRAADAAALAGAVQLPTNPSGAGGAYDLAAAEAKKNGFDDASTSVTVISQQEPAVTGRRLVVTISAPIDMFFTRVFGLNQIMSTRIARAQYVLPVPMGSPENYYGVFGLTRGLTSTSTTTVNVLSHPPGDSGFRVPASSLGVVGTAWTSTSGTLAEAVQDNDGAFAQADADGDVQHWSNFGLLAGLQSTDTATTVNGIEVELIDAYVESACSGASIQVDLSYDGGSHWTSAAADNVAPAAGDLTTSSSTDYTVGSTSNLNAWSLASPAHTWTGDDLGNSNFRLRLTANKGCGAGSPRIRVDQIRVRALYDIDRITPTVTTVTTDLPDVNLQGPGDPCANGVPNCYRASGIALNPRGFWGTMNTQGAENVDGDAHQPYFDDNSSSDTNADYEAEDFYNYAVEMPPGSTGGSVYVYDPVFCATRNDKGTGDRWFSGAGDPVSSFFELWDTQGTLHDMTDDILLVSSDGLFRSISASDTTMDGPTGAPAECRSTADAAYGDGRDYHNQWYLLASGLTGGTNGTYYRIHTTSTDPLNGTDQLGTDGENSFALFAEASITPRIYGIGAMQAFTPLKAAGSAVQSEFYLAQIDDVHAGKTVEIKLWDPGDTNPLSASLAILIPDSGGWSTIDFDYTAARGTTNGAAASCNTLAGNDVSSVQTNVGATSGTFNGCWLTILVPIPGDYVADQDGWWKIRYTMNGTGTSNDVTTWKVAIRGNPVHLIVP